jgi:hypothetical protein
METMDHQDELQGFFEHSRMHNAREECCVCEEMQEKCEPDVPLYLRAVAGKSVISPSTPMPRTYALICAVASEKKSYG